MNEEQRLILAHVVVDPDAWLTHAQSTFGEEAAQVFMEQKVERYRSDYESKSALSGYKNRAQRDAEQNLL